MGFRLADIRSDCVWSSAAPLKHSRRAPHAAAAATGFQLDASFRHISAMTRIIISARHNADAFSFAVMSGLRQESHAYFGHAMVRSYWRDSLLF